MNAPLKSAPARLFAAVVLIGLMVWIQNNSLVRHNNYASNETPIRNIVSDEQNLKKDYGRRRPSSSPSLRHNLILRSSEKKIYTKHKENASTRVQNVVMPPSLPPTPCKLLPRPIPMILMTLGRSGSSSMYQVMSRLSGKQSHQIYEYTGSSTAKSKTFFRSQVPRKDKHGDWLMKYLCAMQSNYPKAGVVGFKWKPYETLFTEEKALQGLSLLGRHHQIKVVRSRRNYLDVEISRHKHSLSKISAHCAKGDEECIQEQLKAGTGILLPTRRLIAQLKELDDMETRVDELLTSFNISAIYVSFEKLFSAGSDTSEWVRIFEYLGVGPTSNLTIGDVERAGHAATSIPFHNMTLSNYEEVQEVLAGTKFEHYLH